jgi:hypothetical protein
VNTALMPASKMLSTFIKENITPALVAAGFKAQGKIYRRINADVIQLIEIENGKHNDAKRARFTIEVGVCFPNLLKTLATLEQFADYQALHANPTITQCVVRRRLGEFLDTPQDTWWTVSAVTNTLPAPETIMEPLLARAMPWLDSMLSLDALVTDANTKHPLTHKALHIAALAAAGQADKAATAISAYTKVRYGTAEAQAKLSQEMHKLITG